MYFRAYLKKVVLGFAFVSFLSSDTRIRNEFDFWQHVILKSTHTNVVLSSPPPPSFPYRHHFFNCNENSINTNKPLYATFVLHILFFIYFQTVGACLKTGCTVLGISGIQTTSARVSTARVSLMNRCDHFCSIIYFCVS